MLKNFSVGDKIIKIIPRSGTSIYEHRVVGFLGCLVAVGERDREGDNEVVYWYTQEVFEKRFKETCAECGK